jgi:hypothetical protein
MSTRERWIVYPLLFMTLGIALRDKIKPPIHLGNRGVRIEAGEIVAGRISCGQLKVQETAVCNRLEARRSECRTLLIYGASDQPVIVALADARTHAGVIETFGANGLPQVQLLSTSDGGIVSTIGRAGRAQLIMGDIDQTLGVFGRVPGQTPPLLLTRPWRIEGSQPAPQPPQKPAVPGAAPAKQPPQKTPEPEKENR